MWPAVWLSGSRCRPAAARMRGSGSWWRRSGGSEPGHREPAGRRRAPRGLRRPRCPGAVRTRFFRAARAETTQGRESIFVPEYLSSYVLSHGLTDVLEKSEPRSSSRCRVGHPQAPIRWDDAHFRAGYDGLTAQRHAGMANACSAWPVWPARKRARYVLVNPGSTATSFAGELRLHEDRLPVLLLRSHGQRQPPYLVEPTGMSATFLRASARWTSAAALSAASSAVRPNAQPSRSSHAQASSALAPASSATPRINHQRSRIAPPHGAGRHNGSKTQHPWAGTVRSLSCSSHDHKTDIIRLCRSLGWGRTPGSGYGSVGSEFLLMRWCLPFSGSE